MTTRTLLALAAVGSFGFVCLGSGEVHDPPAHDAPSAAHSAAPAPASNAAAPTPDQAMKLLVEGNQRFVSSQPEHLRTDQARRCDTFTNGQHPFAVVLACADSRVPPEILFDQGIGDLFVIRVAGNVADTDEIGTIEYGIGHLHSPLVVVLGHSKCGAVTAVAQGAKVSENIKKLVDNIEPAVEHVKHDMPGLVGDALVQASIDANVMQAMSDLLSHSEETRELVSSGQVKIVGAVYDIHNGTVRWLGEHPQQTALLGGTSAPAHASARASADNRDDKPVHEPDHTTKDTPPARGTGAANRDAAETPAPADSHAKVSEEPTSSADQAPRYPHQTGTWRGMMAPAAFIGGANVLAGGVFYLMRGRGSARTTPSGPGAASAQTSPSSAATPKA